MSPSPDGSRSGGEPGDFPDMPADFAARMRSGLATMAVRERVRERRRNRALAMSAVGAAAAAVIGVIGWQALGLGAADDRDHAAPPPTTSISPEPSPQQTEPASTPPESPSPSPSSTAEPTVPTPPPGLEGVAAGEPYRYDEENCECGDAGAAGGGPFIEGTSDVYVLCEGAGRVSYGGEPWVDCAALQAGTGVVALGVIDSITDGDPAFSASDDFTGQLRVVDEGGVPTGNAGGTTATVYVTCTFNDGETVRAGDTTFDCSSSPPGVSGRYAAWGVPIPAGELAPRISADGPSMVLRYTVDR